MSIAYWPLFDLRLITPHLVLRVWTESDAMRLARVVPADWEPNPFVPMPALSDERSRRGADVLQSYWRAFGTWSVDRWRLGFVVEEGDRTVGYQELEADRFPETRVVETSSWLIPEARGLGYGKEMRGAVLELAFGALGAVAAETSAWWDRDASLGVSTSLGYRRIGERIHDDGRRRDRMTFMRLDRAVWARRSTDRATVVEGFEPCRPMFGLEPGGCP